MANSMYGLGREAFLAGSIAALTDTLALSLFTTAYTPNLATDQFYSTPIASGGLLNSKQTLTSVTGAAGTLSAANVTFTSVTTGSTGTYLVLFKDTGTNSTSPLIGLIDTATGLPVTTNGGNITVAWASGQVFTLFQSLAASERDRTVLARLKELLKELGRRWKQSDGGIFLPEPTLVLG